MNLDFSDLYKTIVEKDPALKEGKVECGKCHRNIQVDSVKCLRKVWPKCCGQTMGLCIPLKRRQQ